MTTLLPANDNETRRTMTTIQGDDADARMSGATPHECRVHYGPGERNGAVSERPGGFSAEAWHADAIGDSGVSHTRVGRRYVIACQWCRCVFIAGTATAAMRSFRDHEAEMLEGSRE